MKQAVSLTQGEMLDSHSGTELLDSGTRTRAFRLEQKKGSAPSTEKYNSSLLRLEYQTDGEDIVGELSVSFCRT